MVAKVRRTRSAAAVAVQVLLGQFPFLVLQYELPAVFLLSRRLSGCDASHLIYRCRGPVTYNRDREVNAVHGGRRFDAVFFDMGYTLARFHPSDLDTSLRAYREVGLDLDRDALAEAHESVWVEYNREAATRVFEASEEYARDFWFAQERAALARLGIQDESILGAYYDRYHQIYLEPGRVRAYPEVHDALAGLRARGYRLGVISNWGWNLPFRCEQAGIAHYFECIVASARVGCDKPNPCIFRYALRCLNVDAGQAIHVGDVHEADVLGARGVGMHAVLIDRDGSPEHVGQRDVPVIRDLRELLPMLESDAT